MKRIYTVTIFILIFSMLFFPLAAKGKKGQEGGSLPTVGEPILVPIPNKIETVKVLRHQSGEVIEMSVEDYLFSVVSAEMPALYEIEALKAQTVAAYTYAMFKAATSDKAYDITDDSSIDQAFITREAARERWGSNADKYEEKIRSAIKSVLYQTVTYDGKIILAVYHAISGGKTENATEVWGGNYSYLVSVDSTGDKLSPDYLSSVSFTENELKEKLSEHTSFEGKAANWIGEISRSEAGGVVSIILGTKSIKGGQVRKALSLRSSNFDISYKDGTFTFTVRGYGHGIGMSQYGAQYMALQGKNYKEILLHYYSGCAVG